MRKWYKRVGSFALACTLWASTMNIYSEVITKDHVGYETVEQEVITQGLTYEKKSKLTTEGWVDIHTLIMDLKSEYVALDLLRSTQGFGKKDTLSTMGNEIEGIVGGINGSFFNMKDNPSDIMGPEYEKDYTTILNYYNTGQNGVASLIETDSNAMLIDFFGASITMTNEEERPLHITAINRLADLSGVVIFNTNAIANSEEIDHLARMYKLVVEEDVVTQVIPPDEHVEIPENGYIFTINEEISVYHLPHFTVGTKVNLSIDTTLSEETTKLVLSGGGKILENGVMVQDGLVVQPERRHPRSAIGITEDQDYLVAMVVDGRGTSIGATHKELADYLLEYNVTEAMHFDGGGSSALVARDLGKQDVAAKNRPSDGRERKIVNGLGFVSTAPEGEIIIVEAKPSVEHTFIHQPVNYTIIGYDDYYNPVEINTDDIFFSHQGVEGYWDGFTFIPTEAGTAKITCYYGESSYTTTISVADSFIDVDIEPRVLQLNNNGKGQFQLVGTDENGYRYAIDTKNVDYQLSNSTIGTFEEGQFIASSDTSGISKVILTIDDFETSGYIAVGGEKELLDDFEEVEVTTVTYPTTVSGDVHFSEEQQFDGEKALKINYTFEPSEVTQAVYGSFSIEDLLKAEQEEAENLENNGESNENEHQEDGQEGHEAGNQENAESIQQEEKLEEQGNIQQQIIIEEAINGLGLYVYGDESDLLLKGRIIDAKGIKHSVSFAPKIDWSGWKYVIADMPKNVTYPAYLERIYVAALTVDEPIEGSIYVDTLIQHIPFNVEPLKYGYEEGIIDPMRIEREKENAFKLSIFGATANRNRLLDQVILQKVYQQVEDSDVAIFAGASDINASQLSTEVDTWKNQYKKVDYEKVRVIYLATDNNGLMATDKNQWKQLAQDLKDIPQEHVILIGNNKPISSGDFKDKREAELLHAILKDLKEKEGKDVIYINASGYTFNVENYEGIRYMDVNGLWYRIHEDNMMPLNNMFYTVDFYIDEEGMYYHINDIYPEVTIGQ